VASEGPHVEGRTDLNRRVGSSDTLTEDMDEERPGAQVKAFRRRADPVAGGPTRDLYRLIEQATDYILALDVEGRLSYISPSIERDFGYAAASVLGRTLLEFVHPDDVEAVATAFANRTAGGQLRDFVIRARTIEGRYRLVEVSTKNLLDDPNVGAIVINARDVTDRQRAEARFRAVFESSAIGMALVAPDGRIVEANAAFAGMLGYEVDELRGRSVAEVTHPDDLALDAELAAEVLRGDRSSYQLEKRYVRKDGSRVWGRVTASSLPQSDEGTGLGLRLIEDITATKRAEEARVEAEQRFRALVETIPAVTYIWRARSTGRAAETTPRRSRTRARRSRRSSGSPWRSGKAIRSCGSPACTPTTATRSSSGRRTPSGRASRSRWSIGISRRTAMSCGSATRPC
jgi:PAS domain S-box-containing protein